MTGRATPRRYTVVDDALRDATIAAVVARIDHGDSFTAACRAAATNLNVAETTVRGWVNRSGQRPVRTEQEVALLQQQLAVAHELNKVLARQVQRTPGLQ